MKTHTPTKKTPSRNTTARTGFRQTAPAGVTIELNRKDIPPGTERFIVTKAQEWGCSPEKAIEHLLDAASTRNPHAETPSELRSITIQLPAAHLDEVAAILPKSHGPASTLTGAVETCVRQWLCNLITGYGDPFVGPHQSKIQVEGGRA